MRIVSSKRETFQQGSIVPSIPASVSLHWEYGCYGGTEVVGVFSEKKDELIDVLNFAIKSADGSPEELFREFLQKVEDFQP